LRRVQVVVASGVVASGAAGIFADGQIAFTRLARARSLELGVTRGRQIEPTLPALFRVAHRSGHLLKNLS
jgi:hypothetical protein